MTNKKFTVFKDRKAKLLRSRDLRYPNGQALYMYRLKEEEFLSLEKVLRYWLGNLVGPFQLNEVLRLTGFSALFVLYASEWWRRRYDGSGFSWEPILRDLGVNPDSWTPTQRSQCVKDGLAAWKLRPQEDGALRFLGSVAVQGGLPLRLLGEARGGIGRLLSRVLELAEEGEVAKIQIKAWVESLQQQLPKSYRQNIIYELLTELAHVAIKLKQEAGLTSGDDAVLLLDRTVPDWKDRFPIAMEDRHARKLVEQLVRDAANVRVRKVRSSLPVERSLEQEDKGQWSLISRVELPDTLTFSALIQLFGIEDENSLPRTATLSLTAEEKVASTTLRILASRNAYRIEPAEFAFSDDAAREEHLLQLSAPDGRRWKVEAPRGESLDEELPWIFSGDSPHEFLKQGSGRVADSEVFVALPVGWKYRNDADSAYEPKGTLCILQRALFQTRGIATLEGADGETSILRTGRADTTDHQLTWQGNRIWHDFLKPRRAYRGIPNLYRFDGEGNRHSVQGKPGWRVTGNPNANEAFGPVTLQYPARGTPQIRSRMLALPEQASIEYGSVDSRSGKVSFSYWGISKARVVQPSAVEQKSTTSAEVTSLNVSVPSGQRTPEWMTVELLWPHTASVSQVRLPFPASGARMFDRDGEELQSGHQVAVDDLAGIRLVLNRGGGLSEKLTLNIEAVSNHLSRRYPLRILPGVLSADIVLIDYETDIQHLLSLDDSPDSEVTLSISSSRHQEIFNFRVTRYAAVMEQDTGQLAINTHVINRFELEQLNCLRVLATRLENPSDEPIELRSVLSEGVHTGRWDFNPEKREPGTWLIYPPPGAHKPFRPCIWPIFTEDSANYASGDDLLNAIALPRQYEREHQIVNVIEAMAADFQHNSWKTVEQLASQFGHLPLATLDLWRMFTHSNYGMAALAFRLGDLPNNFYLRFGRELPLAWETISLGAWKQAMNRLQEQCSISYQDMGDTIFKAQLVKCLSALRAESGALSYLLGIAAAAFDDQEKRELHLLEQYFAHRAEKDLYDGDNSKLMFLRRAHAQDEWPMGFAGDCNLICVTALVKYSR